MRSATQADAGVRRPNGQSGGAGSQDRAPHHATETALKLDKTRPYGTIHPPHNGAHFDQDGILFDAQGHPLHEIATKPEAEKRGRGRPRNAEVGPQVAAQMAGD